MEERRPTRGPATVLLFGYVWLTLGFFAGTLTLIGPVRWLTSAMRAEGWAQEGEDLAVKILILALVVATATVSWRLVQRAERSGRWRSTAGLATATSVLALVSLGLWMNPALLAEEMAIEDEEARFVFGPYPTAERLKELRKEGFTVISLLHPAVVPFEPKLLAEEKAAARAVGIPLIHAPMLPWVSDNEASLAKIAALAEKTTGRYYVHCYLGKDRVNVVRQLVQRTGVQVAGTAEVRARELATKRSFERGPIYQIDEGVFLTPYPTDEEWIGFVLSGQANQLLSLLDPADPEDQSWVEKEQTLARKYGIPLASAPISSLPFDPEEALHAARQARILPRPLVVHAFLSPSPTTEAFTIAYRSDLPPLPPSLFKEVMEGGPVEIVAANVAIGPRPRGREFGGYLKPRGVRGVIHVGPAPDEDARIAVGAGLEWRSFRANDPALLATIVRGGPWYLYGPERAIVRDRIYTD